jgi:2-iminobutanoate/2-iminopropanoate deaminase
MPDVDRFPVPPALGEPIGLYSHVARLAPGRDLVLIAGQLPVGRDGQLIEDASFEGQVRQVFHNLSGALEGVGLGLGHVLKFTTYVTAPELIEQFYEVRERLFAELYPSGTYPGNVRPEFLVEIEAIAGS